MPRGAVGQAISQRIQRGWVYDGKKIYKKGSFALHHAHTAQCRLSKDNQLRCKCSPEGGWTERSPVSFASEHKVCLWWGQLVTAESSQSLHLSQPLFRILTEKADSCIHPCSNMIHSSHTLTQMLHKHIWTPSGVWEVLTQSPFLLCWNAGKTVVRHGGFSAHVERLMGDYHSVAWVGAEQGPSCWTEGQLRHGPVPPAVLLSAWLAVGRGRKVKTDTDTIKSLESSYCVRTVC